MEKAANSLDYILDTVPAFHNLQSYLSLLKVNGKLIIVGVASKPLQFDSDYLILDMQFKIFLIQFCYTCKFY